MHVDDIRKNLWYFTLGMTLEHCKATRQFMVAPMGVQTNLIDAEGVTSYAMNMLGNIERAVVQGKTNYGARGDLECHIETEAKKVFGAAVADWNNKRDSFCFEFRWRAGMAACASRVKGQMTLLRTEDGWALGVYPEGRPNGNKPVPTTYWTLDPIHDTVKFYGTQLEWELPMEEMHDLHQGDTVQVKLEENEISVRKVEGT